LAIFVADPETGRPVARVPLYAEVSVPRWSAPPVEDDGAREEAIRGRDPDISDETLLALRRALTKATHEVLTPAARAELESDWSRRLEFWALMLDSILSAAGTDGFGDIDPAILDELAQDGARRAADGMGLRTNKPELDSSAVWSDPLGVLTTDHAGYASWDLRRLRPETQVALAEAIDALRDNPAAEVRVRVRVHPYGSNTVWEVLAQARFAQDAVVGAFTMVWHTLPPSLINMGPRALQDPSLTDWRLSPASFAASPRSLVGEDQTEELIPANLALQEFVMRQVVRLTETPADWKLPGGMKAAFVDDYKVTWSALGHSLGEILYSLPLAPGETVRLAVIDWSWSSDLSREESTTMTEDLLHQTHRDRSIVETVKAGLREFQHGSSFMGGMAHSGGGSAGANLGVVGIGAAVGDAWSMGGSTASSSGSRDLAAENIQRLSDNFSQASSSRRELSSTVVIQARQEEKESIQTRTFSNYNHAHTLTVLYYEVLRHYRVSVEWVRRRPAALIAGTAVAATITSEYVTNKRFVLLPNLLDSSYAASFDATARRALGERKLATANAAHEASKTTDDPGLKVFTKLRVRIGTGSDESSEPVFVYLNLKDGKSLEFDVGEAPEEGKTKDVEVDLPSPVFWRDIKEVVVNLKDISNAAYGDLAITNVTVTTIGVEQINLAAWSGDHMLDDDGSKPLNVPLSAPGPATIKYGLPKPNRSEFVPIEDDHAAELLLSHIRANASYYDRVLWLSEDPGAIATRFELMAWDASTTVADHVIPSPLETFGSFVAFPLAATSELPDDALIVDIAHALAVDDPARRAWAMEHLAELDENTRAEVLRRIALASSRSERLMTMPTRGVFAEGKLGHANVAEEIDNTRFWKWEEHPIPIEAPEIAPVVPVQPTPQAQDGTPMAMPPSLVNIVNPTAAPDPAGLAAAMTAISTPDIFRDMSGRAEVAGLLKNLSDNTIKIAEAANRAREIQAKYGADLDKQEKDYDLGRTAASVEMVKELGRQRREAAQEVTPSQAKDAIDLSASETRKGNKTPQEHQEYSKRVQNSIPGAAPKPKSAKSIKLQVDLKGYGDNLLIGRFGIDVTQRGTAVGFLVATDYSQTGQLVVGVSNEYDDPRYSIEIRGEVLGGVGVNSVLRGRKTVALPRDDFDHYDYFYLVATAAVDTFDFETKNSDEISSEITKRIGGSLGGAGDFKGVAITATAEGGIDWNDGKKHTSENAVKVKVVYYTGGFTVAYDKGA